MDTANDNYQTRLLAIRRRKLAYLECRLDAAPAGADAEELARERWYEARALAELSEHPRGPARARWRRQRPEVREGAVRSASLRAPRSPGA